MTWIRLILLFNKWDSDTNYPIEEFVAPRWSDKNILVVKYVDDQMSAEKLDMSNSIRMIVNGRDIGVKGAMKSEKQFRTI